ncbi:MAG: HAMP domain-containing histidine kinase [Eggerthellaceae bacterium]|nr:HAMP domain-containing histidine kinase [Eggerthellaceae bacterium]
MDDADLAAFTPASYLRDRAASLGITVFCLAGLAFMLPALGVGFEGLVVVEGFVVLCAATALVLGYLRRARYYREAVGLTRQLQRACQFPALIDEPAFLEGRLAYQIAEVIARRANAEVGDAQASAQNYREYVELWIHEAKTPIAAAKLILASMHDEQGAKLAREIDRIDAQVEQALYYARSTSLANDYAIREISLAAAAREAVKKNARFLIERSVTPSIAIPDDLRVLADEPWLVFVLGQVVVNAAKYGSSTITFRSWEEEAGTPREHTVLEVRDDGRGIPAADVPRVFERGFTGANGREQGAATGMGLYLVALMCERMGLGVGLASEEGVGTRVLLSFPHDRRRSATPPPSASVAPQPDKLVRQA